MLLQFVLLQYELKTVMFVLGNPVGNTINQLRGNHLNQSVDAMTKAEVVVIATVRDRENIDRALLRPGRLETLISLTLPSYLQRVAILKSLLLHKLDHAESCDEIIYELGTITEGKTPSALHELVMRACMRAVREAMTDKNGEMSTVFLQRHHFSEL